jgi:hypothetical protein
MAGIVGGLVENKDARFIIQWLIIASLAYKARNFQQFDLDG